MAHQSHNIPWNQFASNFEYIYHEDSPACVTNLYPRFNPGQGKQLNYFVEAFSKAIQEHSATERAKYPEVYEAPKPGDVVLSDEVVRKISPTIHHARLQYRHKLKRKVEGTFNPQLCSHKDSTACACPLGHHERRMSAFTRRHVPNDCYQFFKKNEVAFLGIETFKALLLYGEMDTVQRIRSYPNLDLLRWWSMEECGCEGRGTAGWDLICYYALMTYMCLNILLCYPDLWDTASGRSDKKDYRRTRAYQYMLRQCTRFGHTSDMPTFPHRQFFGIGDKQFSVAAIPSDKKLWGSSFTNVRQFREHYPYGIYPFEEFLGTENPPEYMPNAADVDEIFALLLARGLPAELVSLILVEADYKPKRRLRLPHDPLHLGNRAELGEYLTYCWKILVHCDMMVGEMPWDRLIGRAIVELFGHKNEAPRPESVLYEGKNRLYERKSDEEYEGQIHKTEWSYKFL